MKQQLAFLEALVEEGATIMLLLLLSAAALIFLLYTAVSVFYPYPLDYSEAPLVDQAMRLVAGQNIYRLDISSPPYTVANYPPLYVLALTPFVGLFGPSFLAGRAISLLCALATGTFLALILYSQTKDRVAAVITGLLFLAIPYVTHWSSLLRIDLLALALSTAALYVLVRWPTEPNDGRPLTANRTDGNGGQRSAVAGLFLQERKTVVVALLLVAAVYTRQSYALAAPLAAFVWLWPHDRRQAIRLAVITGGLVLLLFLLLNLLTQGGFFFHVVTANVNEFRMEQLTWNLQRLRQAAPILLILGAAVLFLAPRRWPIWPLLIPYLIGSFFSALTIGKIGSNVNYFLELSAALSLVAGAFIAWSRGRSWLRAALLVLLALQTRWLLSTTLDEFVAPWTARRSETADLSDMARLVEETEGPVLADEYMGLITLSDRPLHFQPFEVTQLAWAGLWDQTAFVESIHNQEFPLILVYHHPSFPLHEERWTAEMLAAIRRYYILADVLADNYIYRPRSARQTASTAPDACPGAPWRLPTSSVLGVTWREQALDFLGQGAENSPVYAIADGLLTRLPGAENSVAILHDDPLRPGEQVWSVYADMAGSNGESTIVPDFPPGSTAIPVIAGQLLGYQGTWSGRLSWPTWMHLRFAVVPAAADGALLSETALENIIDPSPYLGIMHNSATGQTGLRPLRCQED